MAHKLDLNLVDPTWREIVNLALNTMSPEYLQALTVMEGWLPGPKQIFNAFSLPLPQVKYILFGESPYPRPASANGYAFFDAATNEIWSATGLNKKVNRATSLRNLIKTLLICEGLLEPQMATQEAIANIDKSHLIQTVPELFSKMMQKGIMLLNASLVLSQQTVAKDAKQWRPFMATLLSELQARNVNIKLILFGKIAEAVLKIPAARGYTKILAPHPYNHSFMHNKEVRTLFTPFHLLLQ